MFRKSLKYSAVFLMFLLAKYSYADKIALTFDDLPGQTEDSAQLEQWMSEHLLTALMAAHVPAIGFVNEGRLYSKGDTDKKIAILKLWIADGYPLGNHTYSHRFLSTSKPDEYKKDIIRGSIISKKLMSEHGMTYQYFRHPYLDTGNTKQLRESLRLFLAKEKLIVAPVTIDTDDWKFNRELKAHPENKEKIIATYLAYTKAKFAFFQLASMKIFGRNISHIWLLHVNLINSYAIKDLLKIANDLGYQFVTIDRALKDDAYAEPDNYYGPAGVSWLYHWDYTRGKVVNWSKEPKPS